MEPTEINKAIRGQAASTTVVIPSVFKTVLAMVLQELPVVVQWMEITTWWTPKEMCFFKWVHQTMEPEPHTPFVCQWLCQDVRMQQRVTTIQQQAPMMALANSSLALDAPMQRLVTTMLVQQSTMVHVNHFLARVVQI